MIYHTTPADVQFIMIDPKQVEMIKFNDTPFLRIPVVTDAKKAAGALNWAVCEMMTRYKTFSIKGVREIDRYNTLAREEGLDVLPKIVIFIDEMADLMMVSASEVEDAICRIAQLGRAAGIHLVAATQRPSVDVVTGLIKANIPSRIALTVQSQVDSRTMIDTGGAEKLLGYGDMLFYPIGAQKPIRVQGCFVSEEEENAVTDYLKTVTGSNYDDEIAQAIENGTYTPVKSGGSASSTESGQADGDSGDVLLPKAVKLALEFEQVSASMLQRRMKVGYTRAARIVDEMEERGFVGPSEGSKPRQILITWAKYNELYGSEEENG